MSRRTEAAQKLNDALAAATDLFACLRDDWNEAIYEMEEAREKLEMLVSEAQELSGVIDVSTLQDLVDAADTISCQSVPDSLDVDEV